MRRRTPRRTDLWPRAWRRSPLGVLLALLVAAALTYHRTQTPFGSDQERYANKTFTCINVVDGDTLDIDVVDGMRASTRIRLWGVDTPETVKPNTPPMYFGHEASEYTKLRVLHKQVRIVMADKTRDRYDRLLAYVYCTDSDTMLNEELLEKGFAYADTRFPHVWRERFVQLEARARKSKTGLWAAVTREQMPEWRQRKEAAASEKRKKTQRP